MFVRNLFHNKGIRSFLNSVTMILNWGKQLFYLAGLLFLGLVTCAPPPPPNYDVRGDLVGTNVQYNEPTNLMFNPQSLGPQSTIVGHQFATGGDRNVQVQNFKSQAQGGGGSPYNNPQRAPTRHSPPRPPGPPQLQQRPVQQPVQLQPQQQPFQQPMEETRSPSSQDFYEGEEVDDYYQLPSQRLIGAEPEYDSSSEELRTTQLVDEETYDQQRYPGSQVAPTSGNNNYNQGPPAQSQPQQPGGIQSSTSGSQSAVGPANQVQSFSTTIINNYNNASTTNSNKKHPHHHHKKPPVRPTPRGRTGTSLKVIKDSQTDGSRVDIKSGNKRVNVVQRPTTRGRSGTKINIRGPQDLEIETSDNKRVIIGGNNEQEEERGRSTSVRVNPSQRRVQINTGDKEIDVIDPQKQDQQGRSIFIGQIGPNWNPEPEIIPQRIIHRPVLPSSSAMTSSSFYDDDVTVHFEEGIEWLFIGVGEKRTKCDGMQTCSNPGHDCISLRGFPNFCSACNRACRIRPDCTCLSSKSSSTSSTTSIRRQSSSPLRQSTSSSFPLRQSTSSAPLRLPPPPQCDCTLCKLRHSDVITRHQTEEELIHLPPNKITIRNRDVTSPILGQNLHIRVGENVDIIEESSATCSRIGSDKIRFGFDVPELGIFAGDVKTRCDGRCGTGKECRRADGCDVSVCVCSKYCLKYPSVCKCQD